MNNQTRALVAEFIGTFTLVFVGVAAVAAQGGIVQAALAHGLVLVAVIYGLGAISGAHINPAVTLGVALSGNMKWEEAASYVGVQLVAGIVAAILFFVLANGGATNMGTTELNGVSWWQGIGLEAIMTYFLVTAVLMNAVLVKDGSHAALAIGFTLAFCILAGGTWTGASLNPARTLGPALVSGRLGPEVLVYFIGPALGAAAAAYVSPMLLAARSRKK